jgi:hypothetical protein
MAKSESFQRLQKSKKTVARNEPFEANPGEIRSEIVDENTSISEGTELHSATDNPRRSSGRTSIIDTSARFCYTRRTESKSMNPTMRAKFQVTMKTKLIALSLLGLIAGIGCANLTPAQQATITTTEQDIALAAQIAAPLAGNKQLSNDLYAVSAVATAYGKAPVPTNILQATTPLTPQLAAAVLPLVTGKANGPKTQAVIAGAAAILASYSTPATTGTSAYLDPDNQVDNLTFHQPFTALSFAQVQPARSHPNF